MRMLFIPEHEGHAYPSSSTSRAFLPQALGSRLTSITESLATFAAVRINP
ncbi:hypothetical protein [Sorangium sp. So ce124]